MHPPPRLPSSGRSEINHQRLPLQPVYRRPGYGTQGQEIPLIVNYFKISTAASALKIYEFDVVIEDYRAPPPPGASRGRGGRGRGGSSGASRPVEKSVVKNRDTVRQAFWNAVRELVSARLFPSADCIIFNDFNTAWTVTKLPGNKGGTRTDPHPDPGKEKKFLVDVTLSFREEFIFDLNSTDIATENKSRDFLKCLMTQRVRFAPSMGDAERPIPDRIPDGEWNFTNKWESAGGGIYGIPGPLSNVTVEELKVCPGVRAWLGLYAAVRSMENLDSVINFGLVNKLFYSLNMNLVEFYAELICGLDFDPDAREKVTRCGLDENQINRFESKVKGLRVRCGGKSPPGALVRKQQRQGANFVEYGLPFLGERNYKIVQICRPTFEGVGLNRRRSLQNADCVYTAMNQTIRNTYRRLGVELSFPYLPLVVVKAGATTELQPMEVLFLHDRPTKYTGALDFYARHKYIKGVTRTPSEYKELTDQMLAEMHLSGPDVPFLGKFGITLNTEWMSCTGRQLEPPRLRDREGNIGKICDDRSFRIKELNVTPTEVVMGVAVMYSPTTGTLVLARDNSFEEEKRCDEKVEKFYFALKEKMEERGIRVADVPWNPKTERCSPRIYHAQSYSYDPRAQHSEFDEPPPMRNVEIRVVGSDRDEFVTPTISKVAAHEKLRFSSMDDSANKVYILLVVHERAFDQYSRVKHACDKEVGIASQVINRTSIDAVLDRGENAILYSLATKINAKLGGINMVADMPDSFEEKLKDEPVMYVGIDVTHPSPGSGIDISIASMVGSIDLQGTRYSSRIYAQMVAKETVECFDTQFIDLMLEFHTVNGFYPKHVVVYRDGVSDSQLRSTACVEINWIKNTWTKIMNRVRPDASNTLADPEDIPTFTYIVVQKKHVTRFIVPKTNSGKTTYENVPSGTVVDTGVISPTMFDFWLASHHGAIEYAPTPGRNSAPPQKVGTSRPAHYTVVYDEWKRTPDQIYELTYRLCFLYARCRKPVSLPTPVYYAHLACEKAKEWYKHAVTVGRIIPVPEGETNDAFISAKKIEIERELTAHAELPGMHFL